ncbi:ArsA family ATPase [Aldersonia kunmingensis]|uniref:ArsA family ATPase n=1 Tax=Aldersonia kunmingensis TaxID=408066 RepID=UPI000834648F|nr:ArsA family ATPase [Aldersonia kunmingensis]
MVSSKVEFFVGKGGAGKTTLACAAAIGHAERGRRVLLVSIDQAHSVADALGTRMAHMPGTTPGIHRIAEGFDALEIDSLALLEQRFRDIARLLSAGGGHEHGIDLGALDPAEITGLPGVQELLALGEIVDLAGSDEWDVVIVDCGATADLQRTIAAPASVLGYLERIWPQHERVGAAIGQDLRLAVVVATLERAVSAVSAIRDLLADRDRTGAQLVTVPERVALAEAARTRSALALLGLRLDAVIVNKVLDQLDSASNPTTDPIVRWYTERRREQLEVIGELERAMADVPIIVAVHTGAEPVGLASLGELAGTVCEDFAGGDGAAGDTSPSTVRLESGAGVDSIYAMRLHLPLVDPSSLSLGRAEDDLIVGADGVRQRVRLASVLRRCDVDSAELDGHSLVVRFRPNPDIWPANGDGGPR